jgi:hypothetical protein
MAEKGTKQQKYSLDFKIQNEDYDAILRLVCLS